MKETFNQRGDKENFDKKEIKDTFNYNEDIVKEPKEGDLVLCAEVDNKKLDHDYEWAFLPMQSQLGKEHRVVLFFDKNESDDFIKKSVSFLSRNYPKMKPGIFQIDMKAYKYWKEEPEFSDVVFVKVTPENYKEKYGIDFGDFNWGRVDI